MRDGNRFSLARKNNVRGDCMADGRKNTAVVFYRLAGGRRVPVEVPLPVARFLEKDARRERTRRREARRFMDNDGYIEGETELLMVGLGPESIDLADLAELRERNSIVNRGIARLPFRQRAFIHAYYFKGYTVQEIADTEGIDQAAASRVLISARKNLKNFLENYHQFWGYHRNG
jgi:RNA polymerase sigma factor (sigma-70 family)